MLLDITQAQYEKLQEGGLEEACSVQYVFDTGWHNRIEISGEPSVTKGMALGIDLHKLVLDSDIEAAHELLDEKDSKPETLVELATSLVSDMNEKNNYKDQEPETTRTSTQVLADAVDPEKNSVEKPINVKNDHPIYFPITVYRPARDTKLEKVYDLAIQILKHEGAPIPRKVLTKTISTLSKVPITTLSSQMTVLIRGCHLIDVSEE